MSHHHHNVKGKNLFLTIILNLGISIAQLIGGLLSGSMALISDSMHNFSDVLSLVISYFAHRIARKPASIEKTYGYARAEIIAAFINSATLLIIAAFIIMEAVQKFGSNVKIDFNIVIGLAFLSILVNGASVLLINNDAKENMNMKSAYLHLFTDMLTSIAVLLGGLAMKFFSIYYIDAILSIIIAIYLIYSSLGLLLESLKVMMQFTPKGMDIKKLEADIFEIAGVKNLHHVHIWSLSDKEFILEAHLDLTEDIKVTEFEKILLQIEEILKKHQIYHFTIQPEFDREDCKNLIVKKESNNEQDKNHHHHHHHH